jgi:quinol monooxygenase YgiN
MEISYLNPLKQFTDKWMDGNELWVQQYPFDSWSHPAFGETVIDKEIAGKLKDSFDKGVRGQKVFADYEHGLDKAKGNKAAGVIQELKVIEEPRGAFVKPGLWARVQFNDIAKKEIDSGEWNYWSTSHYDKWTHPQTKETHELVYDGGGLTNKPYVKGLAPLNFSEVGITDEQAAEAKAEVVEPVEIVEEVTPPVVIDNEINEGGENDVKLEELQKELRTKLSLADDADILAGVDNIMAEVTPIRDALKVHNEKKAFSEMFPAESKRMEELERFEADRQAKSFAESFVNARLKTKAGEKEETTTQGFSGLAIQNLEEIAKKFSENTLELTDVKAFAENVLNNGIVDYGTTGSSREDETKLVDNDTVPSGGVQEVRKAFAELVTKTMKEDGIEDYITAVGITAEKNPVLAAAYHSAGMS